jgi:hypothetical protein
VCDVTLPAHAAPRCARARWLSRQPLTQHCVPSPHLPRCAAGLQDAVKAQGEVVKTLKVRACTRVLSPAPRRWRRCSDGEAATANHLCCASPRHPTRGAQEKSAQKEELDAAVGKLKQLKIELEAAVKVRPQRRTCAALLLTRCPHSASCGSPRRTRTRRRSRLGARAWPAIHAHAAALTCFCFAACSEAFRAKLAVMLEHRLFYIPSFKIYGACGLPASIDALGVR